MVNSVRQRKVLVMLAAVVAMSVSLSACEPLLKKFTRQKKRDLSENKDFIPVLEPREYPAPAHNPIENYKQHYAMVKVWYNDLWTALEGRDSDKKQRYTINQVFSHIAEMQKLVDPPAQAELATLGGLLKYYNDSLASPLALRNTSRIQSDLRAFDRLLRDHLRADKLEGRFVKAGP